MATVQIPDDATMVEVAQLAAAANVVMIERAGYTCFCGRANIPEGWHIVGLGGQRQPAQVAA
jgi:uncharacterized protein YbdZ (MbtH family)